MTNATGYKANVSGPDLSTGPVVVLVLWTVCLAVGLAGLVCSYGRPAAPTPEPPPVQAELIQVELAFEASAPPEIEAPFAARSVPPAVPDPIAAERPVLPALAELDSSIAFPLEVEEPVQTVEFDRAGYTVEAPVVEQAPNLAAPQRLIFGTGEGIQPAPRYPRPAIRDRQEGAVTIRFTVGETGRVLAAEAVSKSRWPLLNESAIETVRKLWRFKPGDARLYEVAIRFELER